jgi:hypothetical protein
MTVIQANESPATSGARELRIAGMLGYGYAQ